MAAKDDLNKIFREIENSIEDMRDSQRLKLLGEKGAEILRDRTRKGFVATRPGGNLKKLQSFAPLSKQYIKYRERFGGLAKSLTTPETSNLTLTGRMLESITFRVNRRGNVLITPKGKFNQQKAKWVQEGGRPFLFFGRKDQTELVLFYRKVFGRLIKSKKSLQ